MKEPNDDKYLLGRKNFASHLAEMIKDLYSDLYFTDVTLVTNDMFPIKAHRSVLIAGSPVLKQLLTLYANQSNPLLFLKGINQEDLKSLIEFMYLGQTEIPEDRLEKFLKVANEYHIKDLVKTGGQKENDEIEEVSTNIENYVDEGGKENDEIEEVSTIIENDVDEELYDKIDDEKMDVATSSLPSNLETIENDIEVEVESLELDLEKENIKEANSEVGFNRLKCLDCNIQYTTTGNLSQHIRTRHKGIKYPCNYCNNKFTRSTTLRVHIKNHHSKN